MGQIHEILTGWGNVVKERLGTLDTETRIMGVQRMMICDECPMRDGNRCDPNRWGYHVETKERVRGCGCALSAKTLSPESKCPLGKW